MLGLTDRFNNMGLSSSSTTTTDPQQSTRMNQSYARKNAAPITTATTAQNGRHQPKSAMSRLEEFHATSRVKQQSSNINATPYKKPRKMDIKATTKPHQEEISSSLQYAYGTTPNTATRKRKRAPFECVICLNSFRVNIPHGTDNCKHQVCRDCVRQYFQNSLLHHQDSYEAVPCPSPDCKEYFISDQVLYNFFTKSEVKKWWNTAIIQSHITNKIYCPMSGCRAVFDADSSLLKKCNFTVCYECHRGFCITCQKPWHPGQIRFIDDEQDLQITLKKAQDNNWTRCPKCSMIVEKIAGCNTIYCSCRTYFCYRCGGISDNHYCRNRCEVYGPEKLRTVRSPMFVAQKKQKN